MPIPSAVVAPPAPTANGTTVHSQPPSPSTDEHSCAQVMSKPIAISGCSNGSHATANPSAETAPAAATASEDTAATVAACRICATTVNVSKCASCKQAHYCSVAHQRADWRQHKPACNPFAVATNDRFGRHLLASRAIAAGEVVLREPPLVRGPSQVTSPVCVGCLQGLDADQLAGPAAVQCDRCGWPVCARRCQEAAAHRDECALTVARSERVRLQHYFSPHPTYQCITTLRCLLLRDRPTTADADDGRWAELQQLESHCAERRGSVQWRNDREGVARFIPRFWRCADRWTEEEMLRVAGIVQINGHEVPLTEPPHVAIYRLASLVEHSCRPNLTKSFTGAGEVVLWATAPIAAGEHLSICYSDVLWGTASRQHHLQQTKWFRCECERCVDVTELGTGYSAVRCKRTECARAGGVMLPASLGGWEEEWRCDRCEECVPYKYVAGVLERAGRDLEAMEKDNEENCIKYIEHYGRWLPAGHHMLTDVKIALVQLIGSGGPHIIQGCTEPRLLLKVRYARELLALFAVLAAAEARIVGAIQFELHAALAEVGRRGAQLATDTFRGALEESLLCAERVIQLLQHEPIELSEGQMCAQARRNADQLRGILAQTAATATGL